MRRAIGIRDVAREAGVSVGTVSRVVNDHPSVTETTRARVKRVVAELKYRPDPFAQSMRKKSIKAIGVVIPDIRNPFFAEMMQSLETQAKARGYSVLFVSSDEDAEAETEHVAAFARRKVDGVILLPSIEATDVVAPDGIPVVVVDRPVGDHPVVAADHRGGSRLAVEHLVALGHRRTGCIAGPQHSGTAKARLAGFLDVMGPILRADGLAVADYVAVGAFDYAGGRDAAARLLAAGKPRPTAIFACSDQQAIGALRLAADRGVGVPADLSVVGFDGILLADLVTPRLTTVVQPVAKIAEAAVAMLLKARTAGPALQSLLFACELVKRDSTAPPPRDRPHAARADRRR